MQYFLLIFWLICGTMSVSAQNTEEQYIGDDTVRVYPLTHRYLYAGVWNRLQLISAVWKDDFRPTVAINKGKMRWDKKEPTVVWICPDKPKDTIRLRISHPERGVIREVVLKVKPLPLPDIKIFVNDTMDFTMRDSIFKSKWVNRGKHSENLSLDSTYKKWTFTIGFRSGIYKLCPNLNKDVSYKIQKINIHQWAFPKEILLKTIPNTGTSGSITFNFSDIIPHWGEYRPVYYISVAKIIRVVGTSQPQDVTKLFTKGLYANIWVNSPLK